MYILKCSLGVIMLLVVIAILGIPALFKGKYNCPNDLADACRPD